MSNRLFTATGIASSFGGMLLIGALEALYGPSLIRLIERFGASPSAVGIVVSAHFVGGLLGVLASQSVHARIGNRILLAAGYLLLLLGSIGFAWSPNLILAITASAAAGLGFGALDYALSHLFALAFGAGSGKMLNLLHGFFGVGAILAPLVVALFGPGLYPMYFTGFALLTLITAWGVSGVRSFPTQGFAPPPETPARTAKTGLSTAAGKQPYSIVGFAGMVCVFVFHVAVGSGIGSWEATYLTVTGMSVEQAAAATSLFWFSLTASRFVLATAIRRLRPGNVVTLSCTLMAIGSALALIPGWAVIGLALAGFAMGPVFPTALAWSNQLFGGRSWVSGSLIAISMVGGIAFPPLLGATVAADADASLFPLALAGLALLSVLACLAVGAMCVVQRRSATTNKDPDRDVASVTQR
ncbi:MFS transporter [Arthrobacter sp. CDRTa11]|uniref:MFS transporter n=1 Tax=Arthrobacter sp. CDRTa11 TaxID=2651199 RepID=UPI002265C790|nr:MFS transporter [Arthrobacter sp. CDRTa11]UZX02124.1 MFS transporter [Arthrobacter sp. CDRTa11]